MRTESGNWVTLAENLAPLLVIATFYAAFTWGARLRRRRTRAAGSQTFENIVAREAYDIDETGYWRRVGVVSGSFFGTCVTLMMLPVLYRTPNLMLPPLIGSPLGGFIGGLLFGILFSMFSRQRTKTYVNALYNSEEWIANLPAADLSIYYQLPCTWNNGQVGVGGILYLGREGLIYLPHKRNVHWHPPFTMSPIETVNTSLIQPPIRNVIQKLLIPKSQPQLEITSQKGRMRFTVPQPSKTIKKLDSLLERLRQIPK